MISRPSMITMLVAATAATVLVAPAAQAGSSGTAADAKTGVTRLEAYESRVRYMPKIGKPHDYKLDLAPAFWAVVAVWSPGDGDVDLELFDDKAHTKSLGRSAFGTGMTDFVAVDGSLPPAGDLYPRVSTYSGTSAYTIEFAQGVDNLGSTPKTFFMMNEDLVRVYDTYLSAGVTYTFTLDPASPYADGDLFLVGSTPGDPTTRGQRRIDSLRVSASSTAGATESFTFTPTTSDYYGVVVINDFGSGEYTLTRTY